MLPLNGKECSIICQKSFISTSALELGIDIGDLDLCILVGYPGSIVATWQRGGRVGRSGQPSAMVIVAGEDALDQYLMRNPDVFMNKGPEAAVVNPENPDILERHVECSAKPLSRLKAADVKTAARPVCNRPNADQGTDRLTSKRHASFLKG